MREKLKDRKPSPLFFHLSKYRFCVVSFNPKGKAIIPVWRMGFKLHILILTGDHAACLLPTDWDISHTNPGREASREGGTCVPKAGPSAGI